jgi:uncharacterized integral membrane protein
VWTMVGIGVVLLFAILVFFLQNGQRVRVRFLVVNGTLPLGAALLVAALLGALLVLVAGAARVLQLRVVSRRHRRADQLPQAVSCSAPRRQATVSTRRNARCFFPNPRASPHQGGTIIPLIIPTIRLGPSGANATDTSPRNQGRSRLRVEYRTNLRWEDNRGH